MTDLEPIQRYVNSDNSCLFSSISYLVDKSNFNENSSIIYRMMIVDYINGNEDVKEEFLGMSRDTYIDKIANPDSWGGGIELKLFSDIFKIKIASIDIESTRVDIFGEDKDYDKMIFLVYNGYHYDPLVMNSKDDMDSDVTIFDSNDYTYMVQFKEYIENLKSKGHYVDLENLHNYKCNECNEVYENEALAMLHGEQTNHWDFKNI